MSKETRLDGSAFDTLTRSLLAGASRRRLAGMLGALGLGVLGTGLTTEAKRKHKKHKKRTKPSCTPQCAGKTCGDDGCGASCGACSSGQTCQDGTCACVPEPQSTTCGGQCATKTNNCGQSVTCSCLGTRTCLSNGTCAQLCTSNADCPSSCSGCGGQLTDPQRYCLYEAACVNLATCDTTNDCPLGYQCLSCGPDSRCAAMC